MARGRLEDKVCVVTGGTRGIGRAIVERFGEEGAVVAAVGLESPEPPDWALADPSRYLRLAFDVSDGTAVRQGVLAIKRTFGSISVLVNCAGVERNELIAAIDEDAMRRTFEVNAFGTILMTQYASRVMRQKGRGGSIINISSGVALRGNAGQSVYSASKGAVVSFTRSAAKELARDQIRVNSVAPGLTDTAMMQQADPEALESRLRSIPLGRLTDPKDVADACLFLASDESSYITGQIIQVDGAAIL